MILVTETKERLCSATNCLNKHYSNGYCSKHNAQVRVHGRLTPERERVKNKSCSHMNCKNTHYGKGFCYAHYKQSKRNGVTKDISKIAQSSEDRVCKEIECNLKHYARGFCSKHYKKDQRVRYRD
ncbi:MAG: hypothetical protein ACRC5M_02905 [Anaeroplasmataceae bacterium]